MHYSVIILAAGKGTRMKSDMAKVLHPLASRPMLAYSMDLAWQLNPAELLVVVGYQGDRIRDAFQGYSPPPKWVTQPEQNGTADAVNCALPHVAENVQRVVILYGDVPLLNKATLDPLLQEHHEGKACMTVLTATLDDPTGYGRIIRDDTGGILRIVEQADADDEQQRITEINTGIYCIEVPFLREALDNLTADNAQGEYYLTDLVEYGSKQGLPIRSVCTQKFFRALGVNSRGDLAEAEKVIRRDTCARWMEDGVTVRAPETTYIEPTVTIGSDTVIEPGVHLRGSTVVGRCCTIGAGCVLTDAEVLAGTTVGPYAVIRGARVPENAFVPPLTNLSPGGVS